MGIEERKLREKEERRNKILEAAKVVFQKNGVDKTSMNAIAEQAELSKGTLYLYFQDKNELLISLLQEQHEIILGYIRKAKKQDLNAMEKMKAIENDFMLFNKKGQNSFSLYLLLDQIPHLIASDKKGILLEYFKIYEIELAEILEQGKEEGIFHQNIRTKKTAFLLFMITTSFIQRIKLMCDALEEEVYDADEMMEELFQLLFIGLIKH